MVELRIDGTTVEDNCSVKVPIEMRRVLEQKARVAGLTTSAYARAALADRLVRDIA